MHQLKIKNLLEIIQSTEIPLEVDFTLEVNKNYLKGKGEELLKEVFHELGGIGSPPILDRLKFDFKINRLVFIYDDEIHFNRYRLISLKSNIYDTFSFLWRDTYLRLCRNFEKECQKAGLQERIWNGPPLAIKVFGKSEEYGELTGNGSSGWKLNAYNDAQYDLFSRLHGYKLVRIPMYENLMIGGSLRKIDDLLIRPTEQMENGIKNWFQRKLD
ncbi:hypothetical protein EF405_05165 [Cyclobacteriaceae bacterium YHN15]|jgi:hypothetical protein|nr:hypothetical protein EF405_05165 [Cyclobacteriaceae bacterium YHN15]